MNKLKLLFFVLLFSSYAQAQLADKAENVSPLLIGETMPDMPLANTDGKTMQTSTVFQEKPTIAIFYRGGWCPYCNVHLAEIGKVEPEILKMGYQIIAISPDSPASLKSTIAKHELKYQLFSDSNGSLTKAVGIAFKAPERAVQYIEKGSEGVNKEMLPVPSIFVLDKKGMILFEYISPTFTKRMSSQLLLAVLKNLEIGK